MFYHCVVLIWSRLLYFVKFIYFKEIKAFRYRGDIKLDIKPLNNNKVKILLK